MRNNEKALKKTAPYRMIKRPLEKNSEDTPGRRI
jgi:hypothetical protein